MFVTKKTFAVSENQLTHCRLLLTECHGELRAIRQAASAHGGIYKCILECREVAHELRDCLPDGQQGRASYLFDKLALIDHLLNTLAALLPAEGDARHTARIVAEQDTRAIYRIAVSDREGVSL